MTGWGPSVGACACWHLVNEHSPGCTFRGCDCRRVRWSWSLVDVVRRPWYWLRGW